MSPAQSFLANAVDAFHLVVKDEDMSRYAATAIRLVLLACDDDRRPLFSQEDIDFLDSLIKSAAPKVAKASASSLRPETVYLGFSALCELVSTLLPRPDISRASADDLTQTYFDHAALLSDELDAVYRRQAIERRGDVMRRLIAYRRFEHAGRFGQTLQ